MALKLYNTFVNSEEEFTSMEKGKVRMYTCGPTVYGRPHIGNYSSFLMADLLRRWLEISGYEVMHVKNITDVGHLVADADEGEDKVEREARRIAGEQGRKAMTHDDVIAVARRYEREYLEDEEALCMREPEHRPRASETIPEMIRLIEKLVERGHAYETGDGLYFSIETFPAYGQLSGNTLGKLNAGARVEVREHKRHPADFALWKKCTGTNAHHILRWDSPWGEGFPGWHIECSAMSQKFLGPQIDIHTGGEDNIFPHHECEIAQSECSGPAPFVRYWIHKKRIDMGAEKMSKSLGNVLSLSDIEKMGYSPLDLRYYFLSAHYRTQLKFSERGLRDAHVARRRILEWIENDGLSEYAQRISESDRVKVMQDGEIEKYQTQFTEAMNNDLNTPAALAAVFACMNHVNAHPGINPDAVERVGEFAGMVRETFGCFDSEGAGEIPAAVQKLVDERERARAERDFKASDRLRGEIAALGYEVRDTSGGPKVAKI